MGFFMLHLHDCYGQTKHRVLHEYLSSTYHAVTWHSQSTGCVSGSVADAAASQLTLCLYLLSNIITKTQQPVFFLTIQLFALYNLIALDNSLIISYHS